MAPASLSTVGQRLGAAVVRGRRWIARRWFARSGAFVYGKRYGVELPDSSFDPRRAERILGFLLNEGLVDRSDVRRVVRPASIRVLRRVHDDDYLASLESPDSLTGVVGFRVSEALHDAFLVSHREQVAGTVLATRIALGAGGIATNLGGGFHHARRERGQGFCVFNDIGVAVAEAREAGFEGPVLVVDLDLHDGDGTRTIFAEDRSVHTFSIHNRTLDTGPAVAATTVALGSGVEDATYLDAIREHLLPLFTAFRPRLAFYVAGSDPARDDRLGDWRISEDGLLERDRLVVHTLRDSDPPVPTVVVLAGGYGPHAWRYSARFLSTLPHAGPAVEPPTTEALRLAYYRKLTRLLRPSELTREPGGAWELTEEDIDPRRGGRAAGRRFLGYYSRHGLELALERSGLLDKIRARGLGRLRIEAQTDQPGEDTLVIRSGDHDDEPVLELRARVDGSLVTGARLLWLEWLLLQDPGASFTEQRPCLPGQRHPGLGLLGDVSAILVLICERLKLDGIAFVPSHFHIAAQARSYFRFLDPAAQARFIAIRRALGNRRLVEAIDRVEHGDLVDRSTGEAVRWDPSPMAFPVSAKMRERLESPSYRQQVEALSASLDYDLAPGPSSTDPQEA